jgi:arylsulfatase A-like enzyme
MAPTNHLTRRRFAAALGSPLVLHAAEQPRPNILWITCEDIGPQLGCYGDRYSDTPNLDRLAARGVRYRNAWSNAPVCAPARTTIISGVFPPCTGSEDMRTMTSLPSGIRMFPCYLRDAGYYTSNNVKEDYNLEHTGKVWDDSSNKAHWRNRAKGQPFFSVFNFTITHESQIRTRPHQWVHDPAKAPVPPYHPDRLEVRQDWAQYYDNITAMDRQAAQILAQLDEDGLADDTIVFFFGDHGSGMPRSKRFPYNSGLRVPLIVHVPERFRRLAPAGYRPGAALDRLAAFIDLAPTVLSAAGIPAPKHMQGSAFLGSRTGPEPAYQFGFRGRMDERFDLIRSVRDRRFIYLRNYMPHKPYGQHVAYMFETPTTRVWKEMYDQGTLRPPETYFWEKKPVEELYDLESDPHEIRNLALSPRHQATLERMRNVERAWVRSIRDVGFLPENEIHSRSEGSTPYEMGRDEKRFPAERIIATAEVASALDPSEAPRLTAALKDPDSAVRYWAAMGLIMRGQAAVKDAHAELAQGLADSAPAVRIAAAEALGRYGTDDDVKSAMPVLLRLANVETNGVYLALMSLNAIDEIGARAKDFASQVAALPRDAASVHPRMRENVGKLLDWIVPRLSQDSAEVRSS